MADAQANLNINVNTTAAIAQLKALQRQISLTYAEIAAGGASAQREAANLSQNLVNSINATGKFSASMANISSSTESFTNALEKNKLSMGQYFRYAGGASKSFGKLFTSEFNTIEKVARERVKTLQTQYVKLGRDANGAMQGISIRPLALDMNNLGTQVMMTAQKQQIFNQLLKQGSTNLLNFGKNTQWAGRQLMVGFTIPLTILGTTASRVFMEIEEQVIRFKRVYGEFSTSADEADKMAKKLRDLAVEFTKYGVAVKDTLEMAADAAAMGKMGNDLLAQVEQAAKLAVLGGVDQQKALETTISLTNAFGTATEDLAGKISFLNAVENQTVVSIEDLTTAIPKAGPVVQQLGGDVEDLAFFLTAMKEGGINASEGANALKSGLASLINPTRQATEMLSGFGININSIVEGNAGDIKGTVIQFAQALDELDPLNRARAIEQLFGKFQFARISTLFQNVIAEGNQASRVLELTNATTEELAILSERELKRVEESTGYKFKKSLEEIKASLAPIGEEFLKAVTPIVEFATKLLNWFNNLSDGVKQFGVIAVAIAGVIAPTFLMMFGLMANGFANLMKGVGKLGGLFSFLSGQSRMLGGGIDYMTQEQLQASAVAASLEQSHSRLVQLFTSEAGTVNTLAAAYRNAVPALRNFQAAGGGMGGVPGRGSVPPKKYAKGVTMVPGPKGKGDIIPAMLSPGEAVIPVDQTAKYFPLIQGIVADNLPGYASSNVQQGHIVRPLDTTKPEVAQRLIAGGMPAADVMDPGIDILGDLTLNMPEWVNQQLRETAGGIAPEVWIQAMGLDQMPGAFRQTLSAAMGEAGEEIDALADSIQQKIVNRAAQIARDTGQTVSDEIVAQATDDVIVDLETGTPKERQASKAMAERRDAPSATRSNMSRGEIQRRVESEEAVVQGTAVKTPDGTVIGRTKVGAQGQTLYKGAVTKTVTQEKGGVPKPYQSPARKGEPLTDAQAAEQERLEQANKAALAGGVDTEPLKAGMAELNQEATQSALVIAQSITQGLDGALRDGFQIKSPSRKMWEIGMAIVEGTVGGAKEGIAKLKGKAVEIGKDVGQRINDSPVAQRAADYLGGYDLDEESSAKVPNEARMQANRDAKAINQELYDKGYITEDMQQTTLGQAAGVTPVRVVDGQIDIGDNSIDGLANVSNQANEMAETGELVEAVRDNRVAQESATEVAQVSLKTEKEKAREDKIARREQKRQNRASAAGKVMGGLGAVTAGLGVATQIDAEVMGFNVGETAQKILPVAGALTGILPMLVAMGPLLGGLVAILGAVGFAYYMYKKRLAEVTQASRELAEAMGAGKKAMGVFAEAAGTVSATELMNRNRQLGSIDVQLGKSEFGETFIASEAGVEYVKSVEDGMEELGKSETAKKLGLQLATAVSSNILTPEQAAGIAVELGRAVGDSSVSIGILGELTSLIGPGGENLIEDGLTVRLNLIDQSMEDVFGAGGTLSNLLESISDPENYNQGRGWLDALFSTDELQAQLAGELMAVSEQRQEIFDADEAAFDKRIAQLKEEESLLRQQGDTVDADKKAQEILNETNKYWENRSILISEANDATSALFDSLDAVKGFEAAALAAPDAIANGTRVSSENMENMRKYIEMYNELRGEDDEAINISGMTDVEILFAFNNNLTKIRESVNDVGIGMRGTFNQMGEIIKGRFSEASDDVKTRVNTLVDAINDETSGINDELRFNLLVGMGNDQLGFGDVENFLNAYSADTTKVTEDQVAAARRSSPYQLTDEEARTIAANNNSRMQSAFNNVVEGLGAGAGQQLFGIFDKVDETTERLLTNNLSDALAIGTPEAMQDATNLLDVMSNIATYGEGTIDVDAAINVLVSNPEALEQFNTKMQDMDKLLSQYGEDLTAELTFSTIFEVDSAGFNALNSQAEYFNSLPASQQKLFVSTFLTQFLTGFESIGTPEGDSQVAVWKGNKSARGGTLRQGEAIENMTDEEVMTQIALEAAERVTAALQAAGFDVGDVEPPPGSGSGTASSWLDPIVASQRQNIDLNQKTTAGWDDSLAAIKNFSKGGVAALGGLSGKLRSLNVPETMIEKILGMDPDEWEKRKGELFNLDANGAISSLNEAGEAVKQAMATQSIGDFVNEQKGLTASVGDQVTAYHKLVGAGMAAGDAYDVVQDKALAAAIATTTSTADITAAAQAAMEALKAVRELEEISEEEKRRNAIRDAIRETNKEFEKQGNILDHINKNRGEYTDAQISAIMNDKNLRDLVLEPNIAKGALEKALANAEKQADLELKIKKLTVEGQADIFQTGLQAAMSQFGAKEQEIELNFKAKMADDTALVASAEEQLAKIDFELDDYQAALQEIDWAEQEINDAYEKRFEALDKIAEANDQIAASQAKQLDLADALSRGDIAAAAKAAQDMRAQQQEDALATQRRMMESAQSAQIAMTRSSTGLTREELEAKILQLEKDRFGIEENTLEPAQERIRLAELQKQKMIDDLEVLGKTRDAWDAIANSVDLAQANGYKFADAMQEALNIVETLISGYLNRPVEPPVVATSTKSSSSSSGSSPAKAAPAPPPTPPKSLTSIQREVAAAVSANAGATSTAMTGAAQSLAVKSGALSQAQVNANNYAAMMIAISRKSSGGMIIPKRLAMGGKVMGYAGGGFSMGSDTIPAMLTPGEFVVRRPAVNGFGVKNLESINRGTYDGNSVYNYSLNVNVKSDANPNEIASTVMRSIRQVEGRRIRGNQL